MGYALGWGSSKIDHMRKKIYISSAVHESMSDITVTVTIFYIQTVTLFVFWYFGAFGIFDVLLSSAFRVLMPTTIVHYMYLATRRYEGIIGGSL